MPWEMFLTGIGLALCVLFGVLGAYGIAGGWTRFWSPASLIIGMQLHTLFICYRLVSYSFALILEISPVIQNMQQVLQGIFQGRTTE